MVVVTLRARAPRERPSFRRALSTTTGMAPGGGQQRQQEQQHNNLYENWNNCNNAADAAVAPQIVVSGFSSGGRTLADFQRTIIVEMAMGGGGTGKAGFRPGVRPSLMTDRPPAVSKVKIFVDSSTIIWDYFCFRRNGAH
ncbi:hypothetical protein niasHS_004503 [Heterodera schachtii]|uniref:Uncharacterized protein n=1 Tax=Heterodera schachtii TaxID=97005 RepID=A0ABD2JMD7_HETSC